MRVKSYYAESVESAVTQARHELGAEAMLLNSRRTPADAKHLGEYEVVFAVANAAQSFEHEVQRATATSRGATVDRLTQEVADLRKQLERTAAMFQRASAMTTATLASNGEMLQLFSRLIATDVDPEIAHRLVSSIAPASGVDTTTALAEELARILPNGPGVGSDKVHAVVGPPGVGKTTTLVKIAVQYGIARRKRVHFLSLDKERVAAQERLRSFAAILGTSVESVEPESLGQAIADNAGKDLILIDTPGFAMQEMSEAGRLTAGITAADAMNVYLVLAASMKAADLRRISTAYEPFRPNRLIFTRLDETETFGGIVNESVQTNRPVALLSNGQTIPEDLTVATGAGIAALLLGIDEHTAGWKAA